MATYKTPKFFTEVERKPAKGSPEPLHVLDRFRLIGASGFTECCIVLNSDGYLELCELSKRTLPQNLLNQIAFDEIASNGKMRELNVRSLHLLNVQMMEQPVNTDGPNDPVVLHGTMSYAFAAVEEILTGALIVPRADFLDAISAGSDYAFQYSAPGIKGHAAKCIPLLLAGSRTESTTHGVDLVLAYPLLPVDIIDKTPGNETQIQQMLYEVLDALQKDLIEANVQNPLTLANLAGINREKIEQELISSGYIIEGDTAYIRKVPAQLRPLTDMVKRLGVMANIEVPLPQRIPLDELISLSSKTFAKMEKWPPSSTVAIRGRVRRVHS